MRQKRIKLNKRLGASQPTGGDSDQERATARVGLRARGDSRVREMKARKSSGRGKEREESLTPKNGTCARHAERQAVDTSPSRELVALAREVVFGPNSPLLCQSVTDPPQTEKGNPSSLTTGCERIRSVMWSRVWITTEPVSKQPMISCGAR